MISPLQKFSPLTIGIVSIILAIFFLSSMDATVKYLSSDYEILNLVWIRYLGQCLLVIIIIIPSLKSTLATNQLGLQLLRSLFLFLGTICFFMGFSSIELGAATAILQINPLFVVLAAYYFLGESLGWRKILGVCIGLLGALVIIRPGTEVFTPYALYPIGGALGFAGYFIATKYLSKSETVWSSLFYTTIIGAVVSSLIVPFYWTTPSLGDFKFIGMIAILGTIGQLLIIYSLFKVHASILSPFTYASIIFSTIFGMLFFDEFPDIWTYIGAMIIIFAGLYIWWYEFKKQHG